MMFREVRRFHFVGIGGAGMSGIAEILLNMGYQVSGSDLALSENTDRLASMGAAIYEGHHAGHIEGAEALVVSSAISMDNVEVSAAREKQIPVLARAEMLAELMHLRYGIAVAGAHGKTTTTTMIATILAEGGLDPTAIIGGKVNRFGSHARCGEGEVIVAEADESDGSFLRLSPALVVVTNIDREHLDYYKTLESIEAAFLGFINKIPLDGLAVLYGDQRPILEMIPRINRPILTYGFTSVCDLVAEGMTYQPWKTTFRVSYRGEPLGAFEIPIPGEHNILNALAAIGVGLTLAIPVAVMYEGLKGYRGVERRFHLLGEKKGVLVIDDYGHHPTEIQATISAAKQAFGCPVLVVFQPHRFTRTRDCLHELAASFDKADHLILTDIYPAGEVPIPGMDGERLYREVLAHRHPHALYLRNRAEIVSALWAMARPGMMVITLGAGDVWKVGRDFLSAALGRREG